MPRVRAAVKPHGGSAPAPDPDPAGASSMAAKRPPPAKRAASAAPALPPTPPRTTHKRKRRSRSRVTDSSSEDEDEHEVPKPESDDEDGRSSNKKDGELVIGHKKRKTMTLDAIAEELSQARAEEEEFWMGKDAAGSSKAAGPSGGRPTHRVIKNRARTRTRSRTRSPSSSPPPAPHLLRRGHSGLLSPPPSRRAPVVVPRPATPPPPEPIKEKAKGKALPERDSPNNPFLADDSPVSAGASGDQDSPEPKTPQKREEKPTLTYVFRGVKMLVSNPHYTSEEAAAEIEARSQLPVTHPDFSPSDAIAPKLLFPEARKRDLSRKRTAHPTVPRPTSPTPATTRRPRAGSSSSDEARGGVAKGAPGPSTSTIPEAEEEDKDMMAAAMAARVARRMLKGVLADGDEPRTRPSSRSGEPRLPEKDRSDPMKRAMGPVRKAA